jgi:hypothetical protein
MHDSLKIDMPQILAFLEDEAITPSALSPFYAAEPAAGKGGRFDAGLAPLIRAVCLPSACVSARILSAQEDVVTRFYTDKAGRMTVRHWIDAEGRHHFRAVPDKEIAAEAAQRLMLDIPPSRLEVDADLGSASVSALLGLIDGWRERTLLSLIDRKPCARRPFSVEELYAAFRRSIVSADRRWLTPLVHELYPGNLDLPRAAFDRGFAGIAPRLAAPVQGGIQPSSVGEELCASLSAPLAAIRLSVRKLKDGAVVEQALIGLRGMGSFLALEIGAEENGKITLRNSSAPLLELYLHSRLAEAGQPRSTSTPLAEAIRRLFAACPAQFFEQKGTVSVECVVAERNAFLAKKKLVYRSTYRIDETRREVRFTEMLKESGFGISGGGDFEDTPGIGFKKESYNTLSGAREGVIEEQSNFFGKQYTYTFDFKAIRGAVEKKVREAGFAFVYGK